MGDMIILHTYPGIGPNEFGSRDGMEMLMNQSGSKVSERPESNLGAIKLPVSAISILQWLRTIDAERLVFDHLESRNIWQNRALGMIAADRWPEHLIKITSNPDADRMRILATLCVMHPNLRAQVEKVVPPSEWPPFLSTAKMVGVQGSVAIAFNPGLVFFVR